MDNPFKQFKLPEPTNKHKHEYQELCSELSPIYGKAIWSLPFRAGFTEYKIREAHKICEEKGILTLSYLIGVLKRLP